MASALAYNTDGSAFLVGRMDGSLATFPTPEALKSEPSAIDPRAGSVATVASSPVIEAAEREPNDRAEQAQPIQLPAKIHGTIAGGETGRVNADAFRFSARAGESWVFEVNASRSGSKLDSFLEVLDDRGQRVPRVVLQAVRDSYFTFRGKNSMDAVDFRLFNWDEMGINNYPSANGEVVRLWLYPRGPDSGYFVYPGQGNRWTYFDTTPLTHALNEPCYVVEPHPPGTALVPNGLPAFTIFYENDDDAHRELGKDSRLFFTATRDGSYVLKIRDVRGLQGPDFRYTLTARPRRPDFEVKLE